MNKELVLNTLNLIEANLDRWDQDTFADTGVCGTTACFAGWALLGSGYTLDPQANFIGPSGGRLHHDEVEAVARDLLGFDYNQGDYIFYWFPGDHVEGHYDGTTTKRDEFEAFKTEVLAVTGVSVES